MTRIGHIQSVQIQRESLKVDEDSARRYDPAPLCSVAQLKLTRNGVIGLTEAGEALIDVHHVDHPRSRNRADNYVSMGFSGHYAALRSHYGAHLLDGIAGENILVVWDALMTPQDLGEQVVIETQTGQRIILEDVLPIPPCEPFSRFAAGGALSAPEMKATLQHLSGGMRGFYLRVIEAADGALIQPGDEVYTAS
ncbi:MAG: MOSC domain-containing protein [Anaerolineae bacterium]|nr:MOSC domain-containing protein [Anaerolineae bacterium]